jgi:hypothetical protein
MLRCATRSSKGKEPLTHLDDRALSYYKGSRLSKSGSDTPHASAMHGRTSKPFSNAYLWGLQDEGSSEGGGNNILHTKLLPQMELVVKQGESNINELGFAWVDKVALVLTDKALSINPELQHALCSKLPTPLGSTSLLYPLVGLKKGATGRRRMAQLTEEHTLCMEYDKGKVKRTLGLSFDKDDATYLKVYLGVDSHSIPVYEYGHRIVAWSMFGPPKPGHEVMHTCNNPKCLSPLHLKYGTHAENMEEVGARKRRRVGRS